LFDGFLDVQNNADSLIKASKALLAESERFLGDDTVKKANQVVSESPAPTVREQSYLNGDVLQFLTETYNYCGAVESIDPGLLWYGVFPDNEKRPTGFYNIQPVDLSIQLSKRRLSDNMEFDIVTESEERSLFLFGTNRQFPHQTVSLPDQDQKLRIIGRKVFPGQQLEISTKPSLRLSATGAVKSVGDCPEITDYHLFVQGDLGNQDFRQDLLPLLEDQGDCGMPEIYWFGDLTGDGIPEIILVSVGEDQNTFTLLSSLSTQAEQLYQKETSFTVKSCN
jgi:hypothetical protein